MLDVKINEPNPFGLYNIAGNAWEWVEDWYAADFYEDATDPVNTTESGLKVRRGGSWNYHLSTLKSAARASDEKFKGNDHFGFRVVKNDAVTSIESQNEMIPKTFQLNQNYPNPFNPSTTIEYSLPVQQNVTLKIYDILGRETKTLVNEIKDPGNYIIFWKGDNNSGQRVSSGIYIYRLSTPNFSKSKKMQFTEISSCIQKIYKVNLI